MAARVEVLLHADESERSPRDDVRAALAATPKSRAAAGVAGAAWWTDRAGEFALCLAAPA